jgi:nitrate reductase alpha subunit
LTNKHAADIQVLAVKNGWMPMYPQYSINHLEFTENAKKSGIENPDEIRKLLIQKLKNKEIRYAVENPDDPMSWPRVWYIWRGNALMSSAKGHEYFLKHYLGTHHNDIAPFYGEGKVEDITWLEKTPQGKMDLVIDINFRMDTSALYSDIVLPTASWYEKADLNSTDMHSFIHPLSKAIEPVWESKSDWAIFRDIAKRVSELSKKHLPTPVLDIVNVPLLHDTVDEVAQTSIKDWSKGECEPIPGKSMHKIAFVERNYTEIYNKYISFGPNARDKGHHRNL